MGKEARCQARIGGAVHEVKAGLEESGLRLRGEFKLDLPLSDICETKVEGSMLVVRSAAVTVGLELGEKAATSWAKYIAEPPTLIQKLGIKPAHRVALLGFGDASFLEGVDHDRCLEEGVKYDVVLVMISAAAGLRSLRAVGPSLAEKGMLWVAYPRGSRDIKESHVFAAGKGMGLVDVKVCRFSGTHTALKFLRRAA